MKPAAMEPRRTARPGDEQLSPVLHVARRSSHYPWSGTGFGAGAICSAA
ncbi:MAG: hypothetical protein MZV49_24765 [Rhodopseudomonas palustris]|nr:hypothetical protein [Rhodopseudomonas palustris]